MSDYQTIGVIGAGAWGTALAQTAAKAGRDVLLWSFEQDVADAINTKRQNTVFLPEVTLEPSIEAVTAISDLDACEAVLAVAPAQRGQRVVGETARRSLDRCSEYLPESHRTRWRVLRQHSPSASSR